MVGVEIKTTTGCLFIFLFSTSFLLFKAKRNRQKRIGTANYNSLSCTRYMLLGFPPPLYEPLGQLLLIIIIVSFKFVEMIKSRQRVSAPQAVEELPEEAPEEEERERERRHLTSVKTERNQKEN